jgi:hypothetical protein
VNFAPVVTSQTTTSSASTDAMSSIARPGSGHALHPRQIADNLLAQAFRAIKAGSQSDFRQTFETKSEVDFLDDLFQGNTYVLLLFRFCLIYVILCYLFI